MTLPFVENFTGLPFRNASATRFFLAHADQFKKIPSLPLFTEAPPLVFSEQHLDISLMFPGKGILRRSNTSNEISGM